MLSNPKKSRILRQMRRFKNADFSHPENVIPCYQEILSNLKCLIWVRSDGEKIQPSLRERIQLAFDHLLPIAFPINSIRAFTLAWKNISKSSHCKIFSSMQCDRDMVAIDEAIKEFCEQLGIDERIK